MGNGKICYIEMPAIDINASAGFYQKVFGWRPRQRGDGQLAFDDGVGQVSGTWVLGRKPATDPGPVDLHHGRQCCRGGRSGCRKWRQDRPVSRTGRAGNNREI